MVHIGKGVVKTLKFSKLRDAQITWEHNNSYVLKNILSPAVCILIKQRILGFIQCAWSLCFSQRCVWQEWWYFDCWSFILTPQVGDEYTEKIVLVFPSFLTYCGRQLADCCYINRSTADSKSSLEWCLYSSKLIAFYLCVMVEVLHCESMWGQGY